MSWIGWLPAKSSSSMSHDGLEVSGTRSRSRHVVSKRLGEEIVLVHLQTDRIYSLNRTAARVWELLSTGIQGEDLLGRLEEEFEVSRERLFQEVEALLARLSDEELLEKKAG